MSSQLNVDTIVDKAGSGGTNVKVANTSTYVSDGGAVTQNTVQGLLKVWLNVAANGASIDDSFNISSVTDNAAGNLNPQYANVFSGASNLAMTVGARNSGTSVVLATGASLNDIVEMIVYDVFSVNQTYTKTESDDRYPFLGNNSIIRTNGQTISADITISSTTNGLSAGPITQSATVTVNGYWSIV